jgi:GntR family transcriptional regulator, rspAB operon transcriptional repressor
MPELEADDTAKSRVYRQLRRTIIMGQCHPDERLNLDELTKAYYTTLSPLRDALHMLAQEGLITIKPRSGYFISRTTLQELRDLFELREILELAAIDRAATRITEDDLDKLEHVHAGYTGDDDEAYYRYTDENRRFHVLIAEASGNFELAEALGRLHDRLARFMVMRGAGETQPQIHARLTEALRQHDAAAAHQAMLAEVSTTHREILDRVMREDGASWHLRA